MTNPYDTLGRDFEERVLGGERAEISQPKPTLADRLQSYAFHVQENAKTTGEALLVSDLIDAVKALRSLSKAEPAPEVGPLIERAGVVEKLLSRYREGGLHTVPWPWTDEAMKLIHDLLAACGGGNG